MYRANSPRELSLRFANRCIFVMLSLKDFSFVALIQADCDSSLPLALFVRFHESFVGNLAQTLLGDPVVFTSGLFSISVDKLIPSVNLESVKLI